MIQQVNKINWDEIMDKFSSYKGSIHAFCKENNISHHQLYYRRKRLRKAKDQSSFHAIKLNSEETINANSFNSNKIKVLQDIKIEIGKATVYIPVTEIDLVAKLLKELAL